MGPGQVLSINRMTWQPINVYHVTGLPGCPLCHIPYSLTWLLTNLGPSSSSSSVPNGQFVVVYIRRILCIFIVIIAPSLLVP